MRTHKIITLILTLLLIPYPALAEGDFSSDVGSWMISHGMELFAYSVGDSMIKMSTNATVNRTETPNIVFSMITYTVDPYQFQWVKDWWNTLFVFYVLITLMVITVGAGWALICKLSPDTAYRLAWLSGEDTSMFQFKKWFSSIILALIFPYLTLIGVYVLLMLCFVVTAMVTATALNAVPPTSAENMIAYIFMAIAYLGLSLIMAIRNILIVLMAAGSLGLAALYLIPSLRPFVTSAFMYFLVILFMQPALVFVAAIGLFFIKNIPNELMPVTGTMYVALILLLLVFGVVCILGIGIVKKIIGIGGQMVI